jgi:hypothetical protein
VICESPFRYFTDLKQLEVCKPILFKKRVLGWNENSAEPTKCWGRVYRLGEPR